MEELNLTAGGFFTYKKQLGYIRHFDRNNIFIFRTILDNKEYRVRSQWLHQIEISQDWLNVFWRLSDKDDETANDIYLIKSDYMIASGYKNLNELMTRELILKNVFSFEVMQSGWMGLIQVHAKLKNEALILICDDILKKQPHYYLSRK